MNSLDLFMVQYGLIALYAAHQMRSPLNVVSTKVEHVQSTQNRKGSQTHGNNV
jgi:hypothetical protein